MNLNSMLGKGKKSFSIDAGINKILSMPANKIQNTDFSRNKFRNFPSENYNNFRKYHAAGKIIINKAPGMHFPSIQAIGKIYSSIPDDKKIPVVLETKRQYLQDYIKNQEAVRKMKFSSQEKKEYIHQELHKLKPVETRFTTFHNSYMAPKVVIFPGVKNSQVKEDILHEYGHELQEKDKSLNKEWNRKINPRTSPTMYGTTDKAEDFAETFALYRTHNLRRINNPRTSSAEINKRFKFLANHRIKDDVGKDMVWSNNTGLPEFEGKWGNGNEPVYQKKVVMMDANKFLKRQHVQSEELDYDKWINDANQGRVDKLKNAINSPTDKVPIPVEEYGIRGNQKNFQEGRHRGLAALQLGQKIPVVLARKTVVEWDRAGSPFVEKRFNRGVVNYDENKNSDWNKSIDRFDVSKNFIDYPQSEGLFKQQNDYYESDIKDKTFGYSDFGQNPDEQGTSDDIIYPDDAFNFIRLNPNYKKFPGSEMQINRRKHDTIYIDKMPYADKNIDYTADVVAHEELHNLLNREHGALATTQLDNLQRDTKKYGEKILNPYNLKMLSLPQKKSEHINNFMKEKNISPEQFHHLSGNEKRALLTEWDKKRYDDEQRQRGMLESDKVTKEYIYLAPKKIYRKDAGASVNWGSPGNIFIHNMPYAENDVNHVADVIGHEELHNVLAKDVGMKASKQLDNIQQASLLNNNEVLNPKSSFTFETEKKRKEDFVNFARKKGLDKQQLLNNNDLVNKTIKDWDIYHYNEEQKQRGLPTSDDTTENFVAQYTPISYFNQEGGTSSVSATTKPQSLRRMPSSFLYPMMNQNRFQRLNKNV